MPLTFPAHQVPVIPLKLWRPRWFDGTALVVGAAAPDLQQGAPWLPFLSHHLTGVLLFSLPFTVLYCTILRRWSADGLFGSLPDLGPLRLRSYRVLAARRPPILITAASAFIGGMSHVLIDSFTHVNRWGSDALGLNGVLFELPTGVFTSARLVQYFGHTIGSLVGLVLFVLVASSGRLDRWYGPDVLAAAREAPIRDGALRRTVMTVAVSMVVAVLWLVLQRSGLFFVAGACLAMGLLAAGVLNRPDRWPATMDNDRNRWNAR